MPLVLFVSFLHETGEMKIRHLVGRRNRGLICVVGAAVGALLKCYKSRLDLVSFDLSSSRSRRLPWMERRVGMQAA